MDTPHQSLFSEAPAKLVATVFCPAGAKWVLPLVPNSRWRQGLVASLIAHLCLLAGLYALPNKELSPPSAVYQVSLAGLPQMSNSRLAQDSAASATSGAPSAAPSGAQGASAKPPSEPRHVSAPAKKIQSSPRRAKSRQSAAAPKDSSFPQKTAGQAHSSAEQHSAGSDTGTNTTASKSKGEEAPSAGQAGSGTVFTVQQVDSMPKILRRATPVYPADAKKQGMQGRVIVRLVVNASGVPTQCAVHSAEPQGYFEASALEAVSKMRFTPGKKAGQAVNTLVLLPFDFRLQ